MRNKFLNSVDLIKKFKRNSIFFKNLKIFTLIIMIPVIIIVGSLFCGYKYSVDRSANEIVEQNNIKLAKQTEKIIEETERMFYMWIVDADTETFFSGTKKDLFDISYIKAMREINTFSATYASISECIETVDFYCYESEYVLSSSNANKYASDYENADLRDVCGNELSFLAGTQKNNRKTFAVCYNVLTEKGVGGIIIFNIKPRIYEEVISDVMIKRYSVSLLDSMKNPVVTIGESDGFEPSFEDENTITHSGGVVRMTTRIKDFWLYFDAETAKTPVPMFVVIVLSLVISAILSLLLAFIMSLYSYRLLDDLIFAANGVGKGQKLTPDTLNEINFIRNRLIDISKDNENMSHELIENASTLKKLQLQMLQTQFTPHFLFNTLQALSWKIARECGIDSPANELISVTSDLLAISLDTSKQLVSVGQEMEYCKKYLKITEIVNKNSFITVWEVDDELIHYKALKLSLQAVLENAVKHGIKKLGGNTKGYIGISIFAEDDDIVFEVKNNGGETRNEVLEEVQKELDAGVVSEDKQIGLRNINKRIKLIFGDKYGCLIYAEREYTVVRIKIPKQTV